MSFTQHGCRVLLLVGFASGLFGWLSWHSEVSFADGLRYIQHAQRIERGAWSDGLLKAVDHPVYPLAIVAIHQVLGGESPVAWQHAAQGAALLAGIFLVIPLYLVALEVFGETTAWLGTLLVIANPLLGFVVINILSECVFVFFWTCGLWCAIRFLVAGRFGWLPLTIGFGGLAYLTRPEGLLLPLALVATLILLPLLRVTRMNWPRWWAAVCFLTIGPLCVVGPYVAVKGGLGTKPAIARLLGTAPRSAATALERDRTLPENQSTGQTYRLAAFRMSRAIHDAVTGPLLLLTIVGLAASWPLAGRARIWLFLTVILVASALALIRLHVTGGYCTARHALIPSLILILLAAHGLGWLLRSIVIDARWLGRPDARFRAGPVVWALVVAWFAAVPAYRSLCPVDGSFGVYHEAGTWIAEHTQPSGGQVLDMTNWSSFFGRSQGYVFGDVLNASTDPRTRWVVVREPHIRGPWFYSSVVRNLVKGRQPVASFPAKPAPRQLRVFIYDRQDAPTQSALRTTTAVRR